MKRSVLSICGVLLMTTAAHAQNDPLSLKVKATPRSDADALVALGHLLVEAERADEARAVFRDAEARLKNPAEARFGLARLQMKDGKLQQAKHACRLVQQADPRGSAGDICEGWSWIRFDRSARAEESFAKALAKGDPKRANLGQAEVMRLRTEYDKAIVLYQQAIADGADHTAFIGLGLCHLALNDPKAAIAAFEKAVAREPASCLSHFHLGEALGSGEQAALHLRTALAIRPKWEEAFAKLGETLLANGDAKGAEEAFAAAIGINAERGATHLGLGRALYAQKRYEPARASLQTALKLVPVYIDATLMLADVELALGNGPAALDALDKAVEMSPGNIDVYFRAGVVFFQLERHTKANGFFNQVIAINPARSEAYVYLGDVACARSLYKAGQDYYGLALTGDMKGVNADDIRARQAKCQNSATARSAK